jgi:hypothetical protein
LLTYQQLQKTNPALCIGVIAGNLDIQGLKNSRLHHHPETIHPFGYMSYQPSELGPLPVLALYAAGLHVGQVMARARKSGLTTQEAAAYTLEHAPAMDFDGEWAWK